MIRIERAKAKKEQDAIIARTPKIGGTPSGGVGATPRRAGIGAGVRSSATPRRRGGGI